MYIRPAFIASINCVNVYQLSAHLEAPEQGYSCAYRESYSHVILNCLCLSSAVSCIGRAIFWLNSVYQVLIVILCATYAYSYMYLTRAHNSYLLDGGHWPVIITVLYLPCYKFINHRFTILTAIIARSLSIKFFAIEV